MGDKKSSSPTRRRAGTNVSRGSPHRQQPRGNRSTYNSWAAQRGRAQPGDSPGSPERGQRQRRSRPATLREVQSPDLFDNPTRRNEGRLNSSSNSGLNLISQLLDDVDNNVSDESVIIVNNNTPQSDQPAQNEVGSTNDHTPPTYSSIHGARPRMRGRLRFEGRMPSRAATQGRETAQQSSSTDSETASQESPHNNTTGLSLYSQNSLRRFRNIPPLSFQRHNVHRRLSANFSDNDDEVTESTASVRSQNEPVRASSNPFLQGHGTEDNPYELSPDTPERSSDSLPSLFQEDNLSPRVVSIRSHGGGSNSYTGGQSSGREGPNRRSFGLNRLRIGGLGTSLEENVFRGARGVPSSPSPNLPPPGTVSDEVLARRLQEEEWNGATVGVRGDELENTFFRNLDSPSFNDVLTPRHNFVLLPPISGLDDGDNDSQGAGVGNASEEANPFFFDSQSPQRHRQEPLQRRRQRRILFPVHQIGALAQLANHDGPQQAVIQLLTALVNQQEMESLLNLDGLDDANGGNYEALLALSERIGDVNRGLSTAEINKLPTRQHKSDSKKETSSPSAGAVGGVTPPSEQLQCHICLSDYESGDLKRVLPCSHNFHKECVDTWLKMNATCPLCRSEVKKKRS